MREEISIVEELDSYPELFERLHDLITPEGAFHWFKRLADTYAPSLTARYTRGKVIQAMLRENRAHFGDLKFHPNYLNTGNVAIELGNEPCKPIWLMAHLDIISYLTRERTGHGYRLTPLCEPRKPEGSWEGVALAYSRQDGEMKEVTRGSIIVTAAGKELFFETDARDLPLLTRVVHFNEARWDRQSGLVYGYIDDAFGCAALLLSALVLSHYKTEALIVLTDEEEGVVGVGNLAFAKGSSRLFHRVPRECLPDLVSITDLHEQDTSEEQVDVAPPGRGALFAGLASEGKGAVTPLQLLAFQRELASFLATKGIHLKENAGYVSRSDCVAAMMHTPNVVLMGFPGTYSHFADVPRAHITDLTDLAKALAVLTLVAQREAWRQAYLLR